MYINDDCFKIMASLEDASIDLICTDPLLSGTILIIYEL